MKSLTPEQECKLMDDVAQYVIESAGDHYPRVAGILYCTLVNLVVAQYANDPTKVVDELEAVARHYNTRLKLAAARDDGVRH